MMKISDFEVVDWMDGHERPPGPDSLRHLLLHKEALLVWNFPTWYASIFMFPLHPKNSFFHVWLCSIHVSDNDPSNHREDFGAYSDEFVQSLGSSWKVNGINGRDFVAQSFLASCTYETGTQWGQKVDYKLLLVQDRFFINFDYFFLCFNMIHLCRLDFFTIRWWRISWRVWFYMAKGGHPCTAILRARSSWGVGQQGWTRRWFKAPDGAPGCWKWPSPGSALCSTAAGECLCCRACVILNLPSYLFIPSLCTAFLPSLSSVCSMEFLFTPRYSSLHSFHVMHGIRSRSCFLFFILHF